MKNIINELRKDCEKYFFLQTELHKFTSGTVPTTLLSKFNNYKTVIENKYGKYLDNYSVRHSDYDTSNVIDFVHGALAILDSMTVGEEQR